METAPLTQVRDAYVNEADPSKNYSNVARLVLNPVGSAQKFAYIFFARNFPIGVDILSGKLRLYNAQAFTGTVQVSIQPIADSWAASRVRWNNKPGVTGSAISLTKSNAPANTLWEFDIKTVLQGVSDGGLWRGFRVTVNGTTPRKFHSAQSEDGDFRPEVLVTYADNPEPPEELSPNGNRAVEVAKPVLGYRFIDIAGDVTLAAHQFQIDSDPDFVSPEFDTGWIAAEGPSLDTSTTAWTGLADLSSRYWRVRVRDGAGAESDWSATAQMRREDKGALTSGTLGTKIMATNRITSPRPSVAGATNWTGLNADGSMNASVATSPNVAAPANQQVTVMATIRNTHTSAITVELSAESSAGNSTVAPTSLTILPGTTKDLTRWLGNLSPTATGGKLKVEVKSGFSAGKVFIDQSLLVFGDYSDVIFSGASADTGIIGPYTHAWTGAADASTSTRTVLYVKDTTPTIVWALAGKVQAAWSVTIAPTSNLAKPTFVSGKVTGLDNSIEPQKGATKSEDETYRLSIKVWDTVAREKNADKDIFYEYVRDFKYLPDDVITKPTLVSVQRVYPWPWMELAFTRPTPPDSFSVYRDGELVDDKLDPGDLWEGGPNYIFRDRRAAPRINHEWTVVANQNGEDSRKSNALTGSSDPGLTWLMDENGTRPIAIVKSASTPETPIEAQARTAQEVFQPVGGSNPILITQYTAGFEGSVVGVLSDDIVPGLTAREMRNRFKYFRDYPGQTLLLYMVDEVLEITAYNMTYRPRAKSGKRIIYDISFDFFETHDRGKDFI